MTDVNIAKKQNLSLLPLRGLVVFPYMVLHFDVGREKSIKAIEYAMEQNQHIFLATQKSADNEEPGMEDIHEIGTIAKIKQILKLPGNNMRILAEGLNRASVSEIIQTDPFFICSMEEKKEEDVDVGSLEMIALIRSVKAVFNDYFEISNKMPPETISSILNIENPGMLADIIVANTNMNTEEKQRLLGKVEIKQRLQYLIYILDKERQILELERQIGEKVKLQIDKNQREYLLKEQLKVIQNELGEGEAVSLEVDEYKKKIEKLNLEPEYEEKVIKEAERLLKMAAHSPESAVIRNYLDLVTELPWNNKTVDNNDIKKAEKVLNEDHYGLEKVKERILEYFAVKSLGGSTNSSILCLAGPPGVGKTSIARSIAQALGKKYVRMSLGGIRDEAEIRGHRKTYIGAMPGRIISVMKQAGTKNPLILLDEIDKLGNDFRGDPASAMLEVLDPEQNNSFRDHFLEIPFDLSDTLFITTANSVDRIPPPLRDRMEIIFLSGYTYEEKIEIAKRHLLPKQIEKHSVKGIKVDDDAVSDIVNLYTKEAGVRSLEREIAQLCRKCAKVMVSKEKKTIRVTTRNLNKFLGTPKFRHEDMKEIDEIGIATGLAWTSVGGETLSIEVNVMPGGGKLELTGSLGDVMKESARAAVSYIRSKSAELMVPDDFYRTMDVHIHVPEGAIPKDGPSAGITIATALISALSGRSVKKCVAMTGEITLRGRVLPIGGLKEKSLAAYRAGINNIIIPIDNKKDIEEVPDTVKRRVKFIIAKTMDDVLKHALKKNMVKKAVGEKNES